MLALGGPDGPGGPWNSAHGATRGALLLLAGQRRTRDLAGAATTRTLWSHDSWRPPVTKPEALVAQPDRPVLPRRSNEELRQGSEVVAGEVFLVGDRIVQVCPAAGGHRHVHEDVVGRGAVPVHLARLHVHPVAR
jgi:hypothetical protein